MAGHLRRVALTEVDLDRCFGRNRCRSGLEVKGLEIKLLRRERTAEEIVYQDIPEDIRCRIAVDVRSVSGKCNEMNLELIADEL
jgi:hypothetical protein